MSEIQKVEKEKEKWFLDHFMAKIVSRKLLVFLLATLAFFLGGFIAGVDLLTGDQWMNIALAYIGSQGFVDLALAWKTDGKSREGNVKP